ncbi:hypothetical protein, partial, partial [Absidia glauca]
RQEENNHLRARVATLEEQLTTQEVELAMKTMDMNECKLKSRMAKVKEGKENEVLKNGSYIVPITVENQPIWALIDSGCNFSSLNRNFVINKNFPFTKTFGSIGLADALHSTKRIGKTNPLTVLYNAKTRTLQFEVMNLPSKEKYECVIGTDSFAKLGIFFYGLAVTHHDKPTLRCEEDERKDIPTPDNSPAGTKEDQQRFKEAIEQSVRSNQQVDKKSFCTVPESIVTLDTPPGKTSYKRQYPLAHNLMPIVDKAVLSWYKDGTIVRAGVNTEWNSPLTLAPKKNIDGTKSRTRPCLDPRHINALLPNDKYPLPLIRDIFELLKDAQIFTTSDLKNAFHRFQIAKKDQPKTTFTHRGTQYMFQ